jgi:hypothetical protein
MKHHLVIFGIKFLNIFFPKFAYLLFKKNLLAPENNLGQWPKKIEKKTIETEFGKIKTYQYGKGKCIWIVHGSSDAYQLLPLMKNLDKYGYCCIAIKYHPNDKDNMSLTKWIKAFDLATAKLTTPSHVITHGLGASVLGNSRWFSGYFDDLTVISPVLNYKNSLDTYVRENKLPKILLTKLITELYKVDKIKLKDLDATSSINRFQGRLSVFYSKLDGISSVDAIHDLCDKSNRKIVHFKGATTHRIINSRSLVCNIQVSGMKLDIAV